MDRHHRLRAEKRAAGLCVWGGCRDMAVWGMVRCQKHRLEANEAGAFNRYKSKLIGRCRDCGKDSRTGKVRCQPCADKRAVYQRKYKRRLRRERRLAQIKAYYES